MSNDDHSECYNKIALFDLDGSTADYDQVMNKQLRLLQSSFEPDHGSFRVEPPYITARKDLIKNQAGFWKNLPRIQIGFDVIEICREIGFCLHMLTKGPELTAAAWTEKYEWCREHVPDAGVTVTSSSKTLPYGHDKSLTYGRVLVDDFSPYFLGWLKYRPRGLVIAIAQPYNKTVNHSNVLRYDGSNKDELKKRLQEAYDR